MAISTHQVRLHDHVLRNLILESDVHLLIVRRHNVLVHGAELWSYCSRAEEHWTSDVGILNQLCRLCRSDDSAVPPYGSEAGNGEGWRIEPDIFEHVVVNPVVVDAKTATNNQLLIAHGVPGKPNSRTKVVQILAPDVVVDLHRPSRCELGEVRIVDREE